MTAAFTLSAAPFERINSTTVDNFMTSDPRSLRADCTAQEALEFFMGHHFSAAPVINDAGQPIGVLSLSDLIAHQCSTKPTECTRTVVRDLMTPAVFALTPQSSLREAVSQLVDLNVHHLFVVDENGVLVGVVSALDVLRRIKTAADWD